MPLSAATFYENTGAAQTRYVASGGILSRSRRDMKTWDAKPSEPYAPGGTFFGGRKKADGTPRCCQVATKGNKTFRRRYLCRVSKESRKKRRPAWNPAPITGFVGNLSAPRGKRTAAARRRDKNYSFFVFYPDCSNKSSRRGWGIKTDAEQAHAPNYRIHGARNSFERKRSASRTRGLGEGLVTTPRIPELATLRAH